MGAIYRREVGAFFSSSIAYVFLAVFYLLSGFCFYLGTVASSTTDTSSMFSSLFLPVIILIPLLTMKIFSEEKKTKTEQGLLTAPVSLVSIVAAKYLAVMTLYTIAVSIVYVYGIILSFFGTVAWGELVSNWLALIFLGFAFSAIGVFVSSLTENQIVSAVVSFVIMLFLYLSDSIASALNFDNLAFLQTVFDAISFYTRYYEFTCGLFNLSSVLYYISVAFVFNFLTVRVFEKRRWS
jgi:ABC-2 type transport system permease protein